MVGQLSFEQMGRALRQHYAYDLPAVAPRQYDEIIGKFGTGDLEIVESVSTEADIEIPG